MAKGQENRQQPKRHQVLGGRRITGTIVSWKGSMGWVKPSSEIDHPEAQMHRGEIFLHKSDLAAGADQRGLRGARVNFQVYADGTGLGAQQCRVVTTGESSGGKATGKGEARGVQKTISKRPVVGKFASRSLGSEGRSAGRTAAAAPQKPQPWVRGGVGADAVPRSSGKGSVKGKGKSKGAVKGGKDGKGKGKGKGKRKGPKELPPRKRIGGRLLGKVLRWSRTFGWLEPLDPIEHPAAQKHNGEVFVHADDVMGGKTPREGDSVDFLPYSDRTGLGAEKCRIIERADGNDEGEELEDLDEVEEAEAMAAAHAAEEEAEKEEEPQEAEEAEDAQKEEPQDVEEEPAEAENLPEADGEEKKPQAEKAKGKAKGGSKGKVDAKGKAKGKGKSAENGKGKVGTTKGKPFDAFSVQRTIEKRLPPPPPAPSHEKGKGKAGTGGASKGSVGDKGKGATKVMQMAPKAAGAGAGKAQAKGGKAPAASAAAAPAGGKASSAAAGKAGKPAKGSGKGSPAAASGAKGAGGLPENWEEHWSEDHGVPYFWNRKTKESRWLRPTA